MRVERHDAGTLVGFVGVGVVGRNEVFLLDWPESVGVPGADVDERLVEAVTPQHALLLGVSRQPVPATAGGGWVTGDTRH